MQDYVCNLSGMSGWCQVHNTVVGFFFSTNLRWWACRHVLAQWHIRDRLYTVHLYRQVKAERTWSTLEGHRVTVHMQHSTRTHPPFSVWLCAQRRSRCQLDRHLTTHLSRSSCNARNRWLMRLEYSYEETAMIWCMCVCVCVCVCV